jgi:O-methyltransferase domain
MPSGDHPLVWSRLFAGRLPEFVMVHAATASDQLLHRIYGCSGASNCSSRSIESSQESIAGGINLATTMTLKLLAHCVVVVTEKLFPTTVADFRRQLGGAHNVCEEDSGKYAIGVRPTAHAGQEDLDLIEDASLFSDMMVGLHNQEPPAVAAAYDFSIFRTIVDVGGATGNMLATVLARHAGPHGILFDRPHVVKDAPGLLDAKGVRDRVKIEPGDFFTSVPAGADAYILSHIIHDWNEDQCLTILGHVRKAMKPASRLLIVEMVLPPGDTPHPGKMLDMVR